METGRYSRRMQWLYGLSLGLVFALFVVFLIACNGLDWDYFYAAHEVDLRSWLHDGSPPLWSYQMCAGTTRLGDPQAFGLSPLFLWVLAFGSFWGTKWIIACSFVIGVIFAKKLLLLLARGQTGGPELGPGDHIAAYGVALLFATSNAFLWHFAVGHVAYSMCYLALGVFYFTFKAWMGKWQRLDWLPAIALTFTYYAGGFYLAQVFLMLPFFLAFALVLGVELFVGLIRAAPGWREHGSRWWSRAWKMVAFHAVGLALASFKLLAAFHYQGLFPRVKNSVEPAHLGSMLLSPMAPTWDYRFLGLWREDPHKSYWIWESSFFHLAGWGLLLYLLFWLWRRKQADASQGPQQPPLTSGLARGKWLLFLGIYGLVVLGFALGDQSSWTLHAWLNTHVFRRSLRVVTRYQLGFVWLCHLALGMLLLRDLAFQRFALRRLALPVAVVLLLNGWTFRPLMVKSDLKAFAEIAANARKQAKMKSFFVAFPMKLMREYPIARSDMYRFAAAGLAFPRCYQGIQIDTRVLRWMLRQRIVDGKTRAVLRRRLFPLIDAKATPVPQSCLAQSYFRQQSIVLHESCPRRICLNVGQINLYHDQGFRYEPKIGKYCRR